MVGIGRAYDMTALDGWAQQGECREVDVDTRAAGSYVGC